MPSKRSIGLIPLLLAALTSAAGSSLAQPAPTTGPAKEQAGSVDTAEEHFRRGNEYYKESNWVEAEASFEAAFTIKKTYDIASNLGNSEFHQGKMQEAAAHLAHALRVWPPTGASAMRAYIATTMGEAQKQIGTLVISVSMPDADVVVNGKSVGRSPLKDEVFVDKGLHVVEAKLAGHEAARQSVDIPAGSTRKVEITLKPTTAPLPPPPKRSPIPAIVLGGTAAVGLGAALGFYLAAGGKYHEAVAIADEITNAEGSCRAGVTPVSSRCEDLESTKATGELFQGVALGSVLVGGLATAGMVAYLAWPRPSKGGTGHTTQVRVVPLASQRVNGVVVVGSF